MNERINHLGNITSHGGYKRLPNKPAERFGSDVRKDISKTSSKYIIEDNQIVYEQYDRYWKLVSRVPWTANPISEKA